MKKLYLLLTLLLIVFSASAQKLTLDNLISLYSKDVGDIGEYLEGKGFEFNEAQAADSENGYDFSKWTFKDTKVRYGLTYIYIKNKNAKSLSYHCSSGDLAAIKKEALAKGMKKSGSGVDKIGALTTVFLGANFKLTCSQINNGADLIVYTASLEKRAFDETDLELQ